MLGKHIRYVMFKSAKENTAVIMFVYKYLKNLKPRHKANLFFNKYGRITDLHVHDAMTEKQNVLLILIWSESIVNNFIIQEI